MRKLTPLIFNIVWGDNMKYTITKPIILNGEIIGYEVINNENIVKHIKIEDIFKLIERGLTECKLVTDDKGNKHIVFPENNTEAAVDLEQYTIECRIKTNGEISGYKCRDTHGNSIRIKPAKLWELAAMNKVTNASATIVNNTITLEGKGESLVSLAVLEI